MENKFFNLLIPLFFFSENVLSQSDSLMVLPFFEQSLLFESSKTDSVLFDAQFVHYGKYSLAVHNTNIGFSLKTQTGELITLDFRGDENTILLKDRLIIVERDSIRIYDLESNSYSSFPMIGGQIIGKTQCDVYISSGIFKNVLYGNKLVSNSILKYDGSSITVVKDHRSGKKVKGKDGYLIYSNECKFYDKEVQIFSSIKESKKSIIRFYRGRRESDINIDTMTIAFSSILVAGDLLYFYNITDRYLYTFNLQNEKLNRVCSFFNQPIRIFKYQNELYCLFYGGFSNDVYTQTLYLLKEYNNEMKLKEINLYAKIDK